MQNILRSSIEFLAKQVEFEVKDQRHTEEFWEEYDKEGLVKRSLDNQKI